MQHRVPRTVGKRGLDRRRVGQVGLDQAHACRHRATMAGAQIVEHDNLIAAFGERQHHMAADETGAAGHQVATASHGKRNACMAG